MASNNNIFCATNPARIMDALWRMIDTSGVAMSDMLIFLPSRRAVRSVERMLCDRVGHAVLLPHLVALGEGAPDDDVDTDAYSDDDVISDVARVVAVARLYAASNIGANMRSNLSVAHDLVRMADYMENEGIDIATINWDAIVDEKYATHFQRKAQILKIISEFLPAFCNGRKTTAHARNAGIRRWIEQLGKYKLVIVCSSTASVPATSDLMAAVAGLSYGRIILPGRISGCVADFDLDTNPYNAEYKFLCKIGATPDDVIPIDVGPSAIDFMNIAFGNDATVRGNASDVAHCHLITCEREAAEAAAIAEIAFNARGQKKSVLVITPDAAGNQRLANAFAARNLTADFSGGLSGGQTPVARAILNEFDRWIESGDNTFDKLYLANDCDLMQTIIAIVDRDAVTFTPQFDVSDAASRQIWTAIEQLSIAVKNIGMSLNTRDARDLLADVFSTVTVRGAQNENADVVVLGTIESRMQTADVVILSGLNDGMFPARGYENNWLPRSAARQIGLPSPDRKVSLMALDFMNLSCGRDVYWTRCASAGGTEKTESRFLSRVAVAGGAYDAITEREILPYDIDTGRAIMDVVHMADVADAEPLDYAAPCPPADWSDVYVTRLELLIHNPYAFYAAHILKLHPVDDYWDTPLAADFGTLVHDVIEKCAKIKNLTPDILINALDRAAVAKIGADNIVFDFWHRRFVGFAQTVVDEIKLHPDMEFEIAGKIDVYLDDDKKIKRTVRARADGVWDGGVMDIKTGTIPTSAQFKDGTMPQLPLEALMHIQGGFCGNVLPNPNPQMRFLQLQKKNVRSVEVPRMIKDIDVIQAAYDKAADVFRIYSAGNTPYEYRPTKGSVKYHAWDDLARVDD
ncbi:MAG: PD-(D/E)XK nuclease family protein [Muribaculaceae bacterium]|nr:PD-(D/E)XK nuclease family protein [Muribaculaceae bacterium]